MHVQRRQPVATWLQVLAILALLLALDLAYLGVMQLLMDVSKPGEDANTRDQVYLAVHLGFLLAGAVSGFVTGKLLNGLGFACATLVLVVLSTSMVSAHLASRAINCNTDTEVLRHWTC